MELYVENKHGLEWTAYQLNIEGWPFLSRDGLPRPINKDDVRRTVRNWPEYGGLVLDKASKKRHVRDFNLDELQFSEERAVMPLELLYAVAKVQYGRSGRPQDHGVRRNSRVYALNGMTYCAYCERLAHEQNNPKLRGRLQGRVGRYAHKEGIRCGCTNRSVLAVEYEAEFGRLIKLFTVRADAISLMSEMAIQADKMRHEDGDIDPEVEKQEAIALCKRRIDATINLYGDGRISREEYLRRVELNEREITYWEARTSEAEKAALELAMCMDALDKLSRLWDIGEPEDRQGMARSLFTHAVFDLDTRRIVDFRLKPWADRFLVLRAALYNNINGMELLDFGSTTGTELVSRDIRPAAFGNISSASTLLAVQRVLAQLYSSMIEVNTPVCPQDRLHGLLPPQKSCAVYRGRSRQLCPTSA